MKKTKTQLLAELAELKQRLAGLEGSTLEPDGVEEEPFLAHQLRIAADISGQINTILDPDRLLQKVVALLQSHFSLYHVHIYLLNQETQELVMKAGSGEVGWRLRQRNHKIRLGYERSLVAQAARHQKILLVNDVHQDPNFLPNPLLPETQSEAAVPLIARGHLVGVFDIQDNQKHRFSQADLDVFSTLSRQIAIALDNARLYTSAQRELIERKQAEQALRENSARIRAIVETAVDSIITIDERGNIESLNPATERLFGYTAKELMGKNVKLLMPSPYQEEHDDYLSHYLRTGQKKIIGIGREVLGQRKDGTIFPINLAVSEVQLDERRLFTGIVRDISENKEAEGKLRYQANLLQNVSDAIISTDLNFRIESWNKAAEAIYGWQAKEAVGQTVSETINPEFMRGSKESVIQEFCDQGSWQGEVIQKDKAGREINILSSVTMIRDEQGDPTGVVAVNRNVTEYRQAEAALQESQARLSLITEQVPILVWAADCDLRLNFILGAAALTLSQDISESYLGKTLFEVFNTDNSQFPPIAAHLSALQGRPAECDVRLGSVIFSMQVTPLYNAANQITGCVAAGIDVTERVGAEAKIRQLNAELEAANKEMEAFAYSVSHDLRAPLRAIHGFSRVLQKGHSTDLPNKAKHYLDRIGENVHQMSTLIDDLLTLSRLGRQSLQKETVDPAKLARQALADLANELENEREGRQVEITIKQLPVCQADPVLLKQVFLNLLANALKYSRQREVAHIEVDFLEIEEHPIYFVRDNGVGFDMRYADKLFTVFQRLHRAEDYEGTGVGLAIVQRLIHRHGGKVWAEAEVDKGATFYFTI